MSFILDALRKVDRTRKSEPPRPEDLVVMEGGRQWGATRRGTPFIVALLSVLALGLSGYALLRTLAPAGEAGEGGSPIPAAPSPPSLRVPEPAPLPPRVISTPAPVSSPAPPSPAADSPGPQLETGPPVRLVGRNRSPAETPSEEPPSDEPAPADLGLPPLVLQGTSVVSDRPVAVVNHQRVFEGDIVEGARVVRISDRAVELEYQGRRFTIRF